ncbi:MULTISPECIES: hypothetical protein [Reichenbachiella]|uniref:hypothetical protein n=1 Tax=Reichenbachiella TaxID=156993 RepID=UPI000E6D50AF|nr:MULTISPECIES: hypothetical protein [Reichenbachiella]MBU2913353.1 hypothetical protein [Reichenbachiella agariperforans]RJE74663.1 hypothetical protein BGP76_16130 [Reichenbachiella sp. MSK19-1]
MRNLILILISLVVVACDAANDIDYDAVRRIVNDTDYPLQLDVYNSTEHFQYDIAARDTLNISGECESGNVRRCYLGWDGSMVYGEITFSQSKVLKGEGISDLNCREDRAVQGDPVKGCYGYVTSKEDGVSVYTYTIGEEDYQNAVPID